MARKIIQASLNDITKANTKFVRRSAENPLQYGDCGDRSSETIFATDLKKAPA
jgi:hypothetical protein